jgi:ring-1,2-phenylacetyl-CoA epoxidase subunit PaaD
MVSVPLASVAPVVASDASGHATRCRAIDADDAVAVAWHALGTVPDPEVPVVSIVELGIVRDVAWRDAAIEIVLTPTYSGCPATALIEDGVRDALRSAGFANVRIEQRLAPPWTTDWLAPEARVRLRDFGIAPPGQGARIDVTGISPLRRRRETVPCPRCGSVNTALLSQFGSTACKAQHRCNACLEPFDYFKPH